MPLAFESMSHGRITFGFFNIETDLLLLERHFFYADEFCGLVAQAAREAGAEGWRAEMKGRLIARTAEMGDLQAAIHGLDMSGFIGAVYRLFPFPQAPEEFKQRPEGDLTRPRIDALLRDWTRPAAIPVFIRPEYAAVEVGEYSFPRAVFMELAAYVWQGGLPGWREGVRPGYVAEMMELVAAGRSRLFEGFSVV